jgi:hypothetical protein
MTNIEKEKAALAGAATSKGEQNHHSKSKENGKQYDENAAAPVFSQAPPETDKTDETYYPGNVEFLEGIFGTETSGNCPIVVSFKGNPATVIKSAWYGNPWKHGASSLPESYNNYFTLAAFRPDDAGRYRRQKKHFAALYAVMLDDIGTKIPAERITLPPSWRIETSPGNFQYGYILADPITESVVADRLMASIVNAQLCDPGAGGPTARLARLPVAINGKHQPPFSCQMTEWKPELRYTNDELVEGLQLEIRNTSRSKTKADHQDGEQHHDGDTITIPCPEENAVIAALRQRNLYKMPLGSGKHDITCPWVLEHTDSIDGGTVYYEPTDHWPIGGFKCLHGHCINRHIRALLQFLGIESRAARMKPTIRVIAGEIHRVVDAAEKELALTGRYYQRGGLIVTVVTDPGTRESSVQESNHPSLVQALAGAAMWERYDGRSKAWERIDPPARPVTLLYDAVTYNHLPVLTGLARQPYFRADDTLVTEAGYDAVSGMFGIFVEKEFSVPDAPTKEQAQEALKMLRDVLAEFCFSTGMDQSAALSAILTAAVRPRLPAAPMIHIKAHQVGSGKSYLCKLITIFATPQHNTPGTFPKDDEECRKFLLAELLRSPAVIEFDNLTGDLMAHKSLCIALTSEYMTDRILGISKTAKVSTRTLFLSSGNNVGPVQDMTRRCITIHLDPACETPATRTFKHPNLVPEVQRQRGAFVSAALTIIRAWIAAGRHRTDCPSLAGYDEWSDLCRQPLLWLGCDDPVKSVFEAMRDDPDRDTLGRLLEAWQNNFGKKPTMVREAVNRANDGFYGSDIKSTHIDQLLEVLRDIADDNQNNHNNINRRVLGRWIKRHANRIVDGRRFVRATGSRSAEAWYVESVL